jgi:hypothetical protein
MPGAGSLLRPGAKLLSVTGAKLGLHGSSVNASMAMPKDGQPPQWLVFDEMVLVGTTPSVKNTSLASPWALTVLCGYAIPSPASGQVCVCLHWARVGSCESPSVARMHGCTDARMHGCTDGGRLPLHGWRQTAKCGVAAFVCSSPPSHPAPHSASGEEGLAAPGPTAATW